MQTIADTVNSQLSGDNITVTFEKKTGLSDQLKLYLSLIHILRLYEQQRAGQRNSASDPQTSQNRRKRRSRQGVLDRKPSKDTACDTPSIQSQMRGQAIAAHGYPALCSFQWVIQYIGPPFRDREKDCRKPVSYTHLPLPRPDGRRARPEPRKPALPPFARPPFCSAFRVDAARQTCYNTKWLVCERANREMYPSG